MNLLAFGCSYRTTPLEVREKLAFNDQQLSGASGSHKSTAGFAQMAYRAGWGVPYLRIERTSFQQSDAFFAQQTRSLAGVSYTRGALGLRYDIDVKSALKLELAHKRFTDRVADEFTEMLAQYAIRF